MSLHNIRSSENNFRVAILHSSDSESVILNHQFELPSGRLGDKESFERAALRIAKQELDLDHLTAVARIAPIDGTEGFVLEAATGKTTDLRKSFAGRAFALDYIFKDHDSNPDKYNPADITILRAHADRSYRR